MAYTSPPPTAEPLLKEKPFGECTFQLSPIAVQRFRSNSTRPRGTPILIGAGWRSQTEGETFKWTDGACADPDTRIFPATEVARATPSFIQSTFTSHTGSLLLSSLKKVTYPSSPVSYPSSENGDAARCRAPNQINPETPRAALRQIPWRWRADHRP